MPSSRPTGPPVSKLALQITDVRELVLREQDKGNTIIGEFGQAYWLDKRHGFPAQRDRLPHLHPRVFSIRRHARRSPSTTSAAARPTTPKSAPTPSSPKSRWTTRSATLLRKIEFGATTGRQRMVGWYDAVEKGDALRYGGYQDLVLNKLDALSHSADWQGDLQICTAYQDEDGGIVHHVPRCTRVHRRLKPIYKILPGWSEDISGIRHFADLPRAARVYIAWLMRALIEVANHGDQHKNTRPNLRYIGVGPDPSQIIKDVPTTEELLRMTEKIPHIAP